ncbi:MAG: PP2C family protein-serine/threonine phosphatase, partial [Acidimicrobiales bacterium]
GHHPALVLRAGRVVRRLDTVHRLPFGLARGLGPLPAGLAGGGQGQEALEPGDRVLLYTDGVVEARDPTGAFFGLDRLEELLVREDASGTRVPETMRRLVHAVLGHQGGQLQDDATLLMIEWHPQSGTSAA